NRACDHGHIRSGPAAMNEQGSIWFAPEVRFLRRPNDGCRFSRYPEPSPLPAVVHPSMNRSLRRRTPITPGTSLLMRLPSWQRNRRPASPSPRCAGLPHTTAEFSYSRFHIVMAGLAPAIHDLSRGTKNVDTRDKPGHDEFVAGMPTQNIRICDSPAAPW